MQPTTKETQPHAAHAAHHDEPGFWRKYIFSTDHKVIGIQYGLTGLVFLMFGFCLMMVMRWGNCSRKYWARKWWPRAL